MALNLGAARADIITFDVSATMVAASGVATPPSRVLINAQIAAGLRAYGLRHLWYWYLCLRLSKKTLLTAELCKPR